MLLFFARRRGAHLRERELETDCSSSACIVGNFYTCCDENPRAQAVVVEDGKFVFVGSAEGARAFAPNAEILTYDGGIIVPGFIDGHTHAFGGKMSQLYMAHLNDASSVEEYRQIIADFVAAHPEYDVYLGMGWSNGMFDGHVPEARLLDDIAPDKPIIVQSGDWHAYWVNSAALRAAHIDRNTPNPAGGKIEHDAMGNPNGCLRETAMDLLIPLMPRLSVEQYKTAILSAQDMFLSLGVTAYMDMVLNFDASHEVFDAYASLDAEKRLKIDVFGGYLIDADDDPASEIACACRLRRSCAKNRFRLTDIKIFVDGVVEGGTGFLLEPFETDAHYHGENRWTDKESLQRLEEIIVAANRAGFSVHFHTVGDAAVTVALDALRAAAQKEGAGFDNASRNALTHLQMVTPDQIMRLRLQNILAVVNPYWFFKESGYHEVELHYLGAQRAEREYPLQSLIDAGVRVSMASDYPITPDPNPLLGIQTGVTRTDLTGNPLSQLDARECATAERLIHAATIDAAYQLKTEQTMGSIEVGKWANFAVLDKDIATCPPLTISQAHVLATYVRGVPVYLRPTES